MMELAQQHRAMELPRVAVSVRPGVLSDVPFLDSLQKMHTKQVGWMPTAQFEGKIRAGHVLVAVAATPASPLSDGGDAGVAATEERVGYCIGNDQYFKRDDVGIIYQMNVVPGRQRGLIGASLLKAQFERSAYGCKLYCCWCAQDIAANKFWEAMGFVALAFRTGSAKKARTHIFWQRRIRSGDVTTPYWFPSQTSSGAIREDRLVLPIPPGTHWSDAKPLILPGEPVSGLLSVDEPKRPSTPRPRRPKAVVSEKPARVTLRRLQFDAPAEPKIAKPTRSADPSQKREKPKSTLKPQQTPKPKNDPRLVAAARELRDRWLEQVNAPGGASLLLGRGKYEVGRRLEGGEIASNTSKPAPALLFPAA